MDIDSRQHVEQQDLAEISCEVLAGLLGVDIDCSIVGAAGHDGVTASVSILGDDHSSSVIISAERQLAEAVAISFFGGIDETPDALDEAMRELVNIVGGGLKVLLEDPGTLGLPTSVSVDDMGSETVHVSTAWGVFSVDLQQG